jgi:hypothetical protein
MKALSLYREETRAQPRIRATGVQNALAFYSLTPQLAAHETQVDDAN